MDSATTWSSAVGLTVRLGSIPESAAAARVPRLPLQLLQHCPVVPFLLAGLLLARRQHGPVMLLLSALALAASKRLRRASVSAWRLARRSSSKWQAFCSGGSEWMEAPI